MNEYIFISVTDIDKITALKIIATSENQALSKAYSYFGGDSRLLIEDFNILAEHTPIQRIYRLIQDFTGQTILYFCEETDTGIIDDLQEIDIIKCQ